MLAKVIAHAPTRDEAARRLATALAAARLHGVVTNRDLLVGVLRSPAFLAGDTDTAFLERHPLEELAPSPPAEAERAAAAAAALALAADRRAAALALPTLPAGWRNNASAPQHAAFSSASRRSGVEGTGGRLDVAYRSTRDGLELAVDGHVLDGARLRSVHDGVVDLELGGVRRRFEVRLVDAVAYVDGPLGSFALRVLDRLPVPEAEVAAGTLLAPLPGTVVRVTAAAGDEVALGQVLVVLEAMKMEHAVVAPGPGRLAELRVTPGQVVDQGTVLAVVEAGSE